MTNPDIKVYGEHAEIGVGETGLIRVHRDGRDGEGRTHYGWDVWRDQDTLIEEGAGLKTGVGLDHGPANMLGTLASFLGAAAESYNFRMRTGIEGENEHLFTPETVEWAHQHSDELALLGLDEED